MDVAFQQKLRTVAASVFSGHRILVAYAYGSRIQGRPRPDSDLDVGYYLLPDASDKEKGLPIREEMSLAADLSDQLALDVDLRNLGDAPLEMRGRVLEEGIRIYSGDDVQRVSLERRTLSFYHDYKDVFRNMHEERLRRKGQEGSDLEVEKAELDQKLSRLRDCVAVLEGLARTPEPDFLGDPDKVGNAKYHFVIAIECCIDVANHIISSEDLRFPKDNADSFVVLVEEGILEEVFREPLRSMAKFRNRLVHLYWDIDDRRVYEYLQESLGDLNRFAQAIAERFRE